MADTLSDAERKIESLAGDLSIKTGQQELRGSLNGQNTFNERRIKQLYADISESVKDYLGNADPARAAEFLAGVNKRHTQALWPIAHGAFPALDRLSLAESSAWLKTTFPDTGNNDQFLVVHNGLSHLLKNPLIRDSLDSELTRENATVLLEYPQALQYAARDVQNEFRASNALEQYEGPYDDASLNNLIRRAALVAPDVAQRNKDELRSVGFGDALDNPIQPRSDNAPGSDNTSFASQQLPILRNVRNIEIV